MRAVYVLHSGRAGSFWQLATCMYRFRLQARGGVLADGVWMVLSHYLFALTLALHHAGMQCRVAELYMQTSELLATAAKFADSIRNGGMRKEALRILAERLVAVCCLRSASYMSSKLMEYSKRATEALADYQKKKEQARAVAGE